MHITEASARSSPFMLFFSPPYVRIHVSRKCTTTSKQGNEIVDVMMHPMRGFLIMGSQIMREEYTRLKLVGEGVRTSYDIILD